MAGNDEPMHTIQPPTTGGTLERSQPSARRFYVGLTLFMIMIVLAGFWPSYLGRISRGIVNEWPWVIHLHAASFMGFMGLLLTQVLLVSTGRTRLHRKLGTVGIGYGILVIFIGLLVSVALPLHHLDIDDWEINRAAGLLLTAWFDIALFAVFFGAAIAYRRRPGTHKRLIVLAAVAIIFPGASRLVRALFAFPQVHILLLVWWSPVLLAIGYDLLTRRRIHRAYLVGIAILLLRVATQFLIIESEPGLEVGRRVLAAFGAPYQLPEERKAIALDARTLEKFVGQYQVAPNSLFPPNSVITITTENGKLMGQLNENRKVELFAQSETEFFQKVADVQTTFVVDKQGRVTGMINHLRGLDIPASKVK